MSFIAAPFLVLCAGRTRAQAQDVPPGASLDPASVARASMAPTAARPQPAMERVAIESPESAPAADMPVADASLTLDPESQARVPAAPVQTGHATRFGRAGQSTMDVGVRLWHRTWSASDALMDEVGIDGSYSYFVGEDLSLGLHVATAYENTRGYGADSTLVGTKSSILSGGPMLGWNIPLLDHLSLYSSLVFGLHRVTEERRVIRGASLSVASAATARI